jgi:membrane protein DedA with SNARE-associated domain
VVKAGPRRTELRDYFSGPGAHRMTVLLDYEGQAEPPGLLYRFGSRIVRANNDVIAAITGLPGQLRDNWRLLRDPVQLRLLGRALVDDSLLTARRRRAIFSILLWTTLLTWVTIGLVLYLLDPTKLGTYQSAWGLFFIGVSTSLFLPWPFETALASARGAIGVTWTVLVACIGKVAGSWLVLLMGDKANDALQQILGKKGLMRRIFLATMAFAQRYGYFAIFVLFAIPFMSDTLPLYVLAVMRMKKLPFLTVTFAAIAVRSLLFLYTGDFFARLFG